ncbi:MAG: serine--tRNA ligase, partial [Nanoarchaeota archaeon]|nr:serine--tRNA ligase [Nanoarchaeota archaeon]
MIELKFLREHADVMKKNLEKRNDAEKLAWIDDILRKDEEHRKLSKEAQDLRSGRNKISEEINKLRKEGKDVKAALEDAKQIPEKIAKIEERSNALFAEIKEKLMRLPNILHDSVPVGPDSTGNAIVKMRGEPVKKPNLIPHGDWLEKKGQAEFKKAGEVSGAGFFYLKDKVAMLDFALQKFALDKLMKKGYTIVEPPFMLRREPYEGVVDLADFENVMYKIQDSDLYLIATSEHAIGALHKDDVFDEKTLPIKYAGISACFRKEIGSHGVDTRGIFRVHQFNKIEMFIYCKPEDSWKLHEELLANAEEMFRDLELPYRVVNICTGDIGSVAAKKYDIEVWMPREQEYREVVSCSNCTAYQAVRLNIKYQKGNEREWVHTLNSTAIATSRAIR